MEVNNIPSEYLPPTFDPIITLKDGSVIKARLGYNNIFDDIWIWPYEEMTIVYAVSIFTDINKTDHIRADHSAMEHEEFDHYTRLVAVQEDHSGNLAIRLMKDATWRG